MAAHVLSVAEAVWRDDRAQLSRLKDLEKENLRLRPAVSDLTLETLILTEAARGVKGASETVRGTVSALNGRSP